ncbi:GGDEF domain-containing protein [Aeoliella sp. SH292]|uniref:GGDEF domain-containing protein n=1 Tax=Aeoliella sp. SH292 TaxID=3454464 RepID=UPI003F9A445C
MYLPLPNSTAFALLEGVTDACAVLQQKDGLLVWQNSAWRAWARSLEELESVAKGTPQTFLQKQLREFVEQSAMVPCRRVFRWRSDGAGAFETPLLLHPYEADGQQLVAVLASTPRPLLSLETDREHLVHLDPLTGLPGREAIEARLRQFTQSPSSAPPFALLFIDLDGFKSVNDRWGHTAGDRVLADVASRLAGALRDRDLIARYGGDEFVALINEIERQDELDAVLARLRHAAEQPVIHDGKLLRVSASIGTARSTEGWSSIAELINTADRRMYAEKQHAANVAAS